MSSNYTVTWAMRAKYWPNELTRRGYVTLGIDTYGSRGELKCPNRIRGNSNVFAGDAYAAADHLANLPYVDKTRIGVMRFSAGASAIDVFMTREMGDRVGIEFKAVISVYSRCDTFGEPRAPYLSIIGSKDNHFEACKLNIGTKGFPYHLHIIPGAYHAFDATGSRGQKDTGGNPMIYSPSATSEATEIVAKLFARHLAR